MESDSRRRVHFTGFRTTTPPVSGTPPGGTSSSSTRRRSWCAGRRPPATAATSSAGTSPPTCASTARTPAASRPVPRARSSAPSSAAFSSSPTSATVAATVSSPAPSASSIVAPTMVARSSARSVTTGRRSASSPRARPPVRRESIQFGDLEDMRASGSGARRRAAESRHRRRDRSTTRGIRASAAPTPSSSCGGIRRTTTCHARPGSYGPSASRVGRRRGGGRAIAAGHGDRFSRLRATEKRVQPGGWHQACLLDADPYLILPTPIMRIAIVAPPFIPVPPTGYGGTELFVAQLAEGSSLAGSRPGLRRWRVHRRVSGALALPGKRLAASAGARTWRAEVHRPWSLGLHDIAGEASTSPSQ